MDNLNVEVKYSALYRPESIGMLERQHRSLKDSIKAALVEMAEQHQSNWLNHLPFIVLGKNSAVQEDLGASPNELAYGMNFRLPGQILVDPGEPQSEKELHEILNEVRTNTIREAKQPSRHSRPEPSLPPIPEGATHAYTRQHQTTGLQTPYEGPFKIDSWVSRSVVKLEVGVYKDGRKRYEFRHANDIKIAHPKSLAAPAHRPKLGRPSKATASADRPNHTDVPSAQSPGQKSSNQLSSPEPPAFAPKSSNVNKPDQSIATRSKNNHETSIHSGAEPTSPVPARENSNDQSGPPPLPAFSRPQRSTRNPNPKYVDSIWIASASDIEKLNQDIQRRSFG